MAIIGKRRFSPLFTLTPMKKILVVLFFQAFVGFAEAQEYALNAERIWCREEGKASLTTHENGVHIINTSSRDWSVNLHHYIPVEPGDTFVFSATIRNLNGSGRVSVAAGLFDAENKIIDWNHGVSTTGGEKAEHFLETEFIVPAGKGYKILPRLVGQNEASFDASDLRLRKIGKTELGTTVIELPTKEGVRFDYPIVSATPSEHWLVRAGGVKKDALSIDNKVTFDGHETLLVSGDKERRTTLIPQAAFKAPSGSRYTVSLQVKLESGKVSLELLPWKEGLAAGGRLANGTFSPSMAEEAEDWADIHVYFTVPENGETFAPVMHAEPGTTFRVGALSLTVPTAEEVKQLGKKVQGWATERIEEKFDRGLIAVPTNEGFYLSWRSLKTDTPNMGFDVFRLKPNGSETKLNEKPITQTTDFSYKTTTPWDPNDRLQVRAIGTVPFASSEKVAVLEKPYLSIPLKGAESFSRIAFNDLDGDGTLDYLIKTPNSNIDPYINYWKASPGTYKLQAYRSDGQFMWEYDLGWGIEQGIWYSPCLVADLDGDGGAEVIVKTADGDNRNSTGRVYSGKEYISILDGKTGKVRTRIECPERNGLPYNLSNRHQLCLAYLDGKTPCLIVLRGTYSRMTAVAYQFQGNQLEELWRWDNRWQREHWGQGAHTAHAIDLDGDGRDEIMLGSIVLDDDGTLLWSTNLRHPDNMYIGNLDPTRPGLEIVFGIEPRSPKNAVCMVDAKTGDILWGLDHPTSHIHSQGMCADIDPRFPGYESWQGERDSEQDRWLRTAQGELIEVPEWFPRRSLTPQVAWRDAGAQRSLIVGGRIVKFPSGDRVEETRIEGSIRVIADVFGDWREEIITSHEGEIRIYPSVVPATNRRTTLLQDPSYRATMTESSMGYPQIPVPSYSLE